MFATVGIDLAHIAPKQNQHPAGNLHDLHLGAAEGVQAQGAGRQAGIRRVVRILKTIGAKRRLAGFKLLSCPGGHGNIRPGRE